MDKTMKGICLNENRELEMRSFPIPDTDETSVLVKIKYAGICSTDIGYLRHGSKKLKLPVILGHEATGSVVKTGADVKELKIGDRVVLTNDYYVCGKCRYCRSGQINMCVERRSIGSANNGAFADYIVMPERAVLKLPDSIDDTAATLLEPLACGVHAIISRAHAAVGQTVLISGPGMMGAVSMLAAKAAGCKTIVVGLPRDADRLALIKSIGADGVCSGDDEELESAIAEISAGKGVDIAVECAGHPSSMNRCIKYLNTQGKYVQLALFHDSVTADMSALSAKELTMIGAYAKTMDDWELTLQLVSEGIVDPRPLATAFMQVNDWEKGFRTTENGDEMKVIFEL